MGSKTYTPVRSPAMICRTVRMIGEAS